MWIEWNHPEAALALPINSNFNSDFPLIPSKQTHGMLVLQVIHAFKLLN